MHIQKRLRSNWLTTAAVCGIAAIQMATPHTAFAQASENNATPQDAAQIEDIVVTARGRQEALRDVPVAASVLNTADTLRAGANIANITALVPTLRISRSGAGAGGSISIRGIASSISNGALEQKVALNIDGVQVGRARFLTAGMFDVASVEVLKGPQSLYFGKNATAGVLSLNSSDPSSTAEGYARAGYEVEASEYIFEGAYSLPLSDSLRARIAGRYSDMTKGWLRNDTPVIFQAGNNAYSGMPPFDTLPRLKTLTLRGTLVYDPGSAFDANLKVTYARSETPGTRGETPAQAVCAPGRANAGVSGGTAEPWDDCRLNNTIVQGVLPPQQAANYPESEYGGMGGSLSKSLLASLRMNYKLGDMTLTSITGIATLDYNDIADSASSAFTYAYGQSNEQYSQYSEELRLASNFSGPVNFTIGALVSTSTKKYTGCGIPFAGIGVDPRNGRSNGFCSYYRAVTDTASGFAQLSWKILPTLELAGGARYTYEKQKGKEGNTFINQTSVPLVTNFSPEGYIFGNSIVSKDLSPEVTLTWKPVDPIMVYAAYRTASLGGGISNPSTITRGVTPDNIVFRSEDAESYEAGLRFEALDNRLRGNITVFRTDYTNLQVSALDSATLSYILRNVGAARTEGVEVGLDAKVSDNLRLRGEATYANAKFRSFPNAQCYSGQTAAQGCVGNTQNLSGKQLPRAPKFVASVGAVFNHDIDQDWRFNASTDIRYNSKYNYVETNNPVASQKAFVTIDLRAGVSSQDWDFSVIGRNVTDEYYGTSAIDQPRGLNGQISAIAARPREIVFQITRNF